MTAIERKRIRLNDFSSSDEEIKKLIVNELDCSEYDLMLEELKPPYCTEDISASYLKLFKQKFIYNDETASFTTGRTNHINDIRVLDLTHCVYLGPDKTLPNVATLKDYYQLLTGEIVGKETLEALDNIPNFEIGTNGKLIKSYKNFYEALLKDDQLIELFYYDDFTQEICFNRKPFWRKAKRDDKLIDYDYICLASYIETTYGLYDNIKLRGALEMVAKKITINRPLRWLKSLVWDKQSRIKYCLTKFLAVPAEPLYQWMFTDWLIAIVKRIQMPSFHYDKCLVFTGEQGIGKSLFFRKMATFGGQEYYADIRFDFKEEKEMVLKILGAIIVEWKEMAGYSRRDIDNIKSFLDRDYDTIRKPYGRLSEQIYRTCIFGASTNRDTPLRDQTGNRRFYVIPSTLDHCECRINQTDSEFTPSYIAQLYAEAKDLAETWTGIMPQEILKAWIEQNELNTEESPLEGLINSYLEMRIPANWYQLTTAQMIDYYKNYDFLEKKPRLFTQFSNLVKRTKIAIKEIEIMIAPRQQLTNIDINIVIQVLKNNGYHYTRSDFGVFGTTGYRKDDI